MNETRQITTANRQALQSAIADGYKFQVEFGQPEANPTPGLAYFCKNIETARAIYAANKNEGSLCLVQEWTGLEAKTLFQGWVKG